jgi:hypothetical protein
MAIYKFGKPSISMGHLYHGYVSHNQRVRISHGLNQYTSGRPKMTNYTQKKYGLTPCGHFLNELREEKSGHHTKNNGVIPFNIP